MAVQASLNPVRFPRRARPRGADGFTLLEVLVATAVMGLVLVVLLQVLTSAMQAQETSWTHTQALLIAEKVLQETCDLARLENATFQGREGNYEYLVRITPQFEVSTPFSHRKLRCAVIDIQVSWQERGRHKSLALQTVRAAALKS
jgi:prepilin-type N-terminal cleavage/methylation domain-containing protein